MTDDSESHLSQLADEMEEVQLETGAELLDHAANMLEDRRLSALELRFLSARLSEALRDALRVAESRGGRLSEPDDDEAEREKLPTSASGKADELDRTGDTGMGDCTSSEQVREPWARRTDGADAPDHL
ncbi:hypothetical protein ACWGJW_10555 [Streptomyces nigrescens]